jgi:hypothetical protein
MKPAPALAIMLMILAACSPKAPAIEGAQPAPTAEPAVPAVLNGPVAGKWKVTRTVRGQALPPEEVCYENQMELSQTLKGEDQPNIKCSQQSASRQGDAYAVHRVCAMEIMDKTYTLTTDMKATGDFRTKYTVDITVRSEPELMQGMGEQAIRSVAERVGDCDPK